jgi:hypothetical protein
MASLRLRSDVRALQIRPLTPAPLTSLIRCERGVDNTTGLTHELTAGMDNSKCDVKVAVWNPTTRKAIFSSGISTFVAITSNILELIDYRKAEQAIAMEATSD